ncbi:MAG: TonB family protein [Betaproteobacteria bacterium]|nr:TonB family protein [Betaproteobacteria bacterium]MSQ88113.1 TonB family protein [Betaproteobacteria bacterium]
MSVAVSILLHAVLLTIQFRFPDALRWQSANQPLEVILVNAKTSDPPSRAKALAQANLDGGGNTDEKLRASSPAPVSNPRNPGRDLSESQRRQRELEAQQHKLLALNREPGAKVPTESQQQTSAEATSQVSGRDMAERSLAILHLQAQIARQTQDHQERPRKRFIGANTKEYRFAQYEEDWRAKIERVGTLNYPAEARGKLYGELRLTVTIRPDGTVEAIDLDRSSGLRVLDQAAFRIVQMAAPFAAFPADIRKDTDLLVITRTWFFARGDKVWTE